MASLDKETEDRRKDQMEFLELKIKVIDIKKVSVRAQQQNRIRQGKESVNLNKRKEIIQSKQERKWSEKNKQTLRDVDYNKRSRHQSPRR